jgi:hypothetical protein
MRREPDERFHATVTAQLEPAHPVEAKFWRCSRNLETCEHVARALEIYGDMFERERLQPWILAGATNDDIARRVGVHPEMVETYRHLFFNMTMFRDLLEKQRWVSMYERRPGATREGALYLQKAMLHGVEAVAHVMGAPVELDPGHVIDSAMRDSFFRGLAARDAKLTSNEAAAAHGFLKTAIGIANEQAKVKPPGVNDILIRIKNRDDTKPLSVVQADAEILH